LRLAFGGIVNTDLIRDNFVQIMLVVDQYLLNGTPCFSDVRVMAGLVCPYGMTDKITEKFIGKAKDYDTKTLSNFVQATQTTFDIFKYDDMAFETNNQLLFDFVDYVELTYDK
jgi:hypothetical protein